MRAAAIAASRRVRVAALATRGRVRIAAAVEPLAAAGPRQRFRPAAQATHDAHRRSDRRPRRRLLSTRPRRRRRPSFARDLVALTKPRIISLLLVTTIAPMYVAGDPGWTLVLAVFVGGYLMAGGAERGEHVHRPRHRRRDGAHAAAPHPERTHAPRAPCSPSASLVATAATWLLAHVANVLTAALALAGFYFYVFIYTRWLKRSYAAEHRHRRRGRRLPAARGLGSGHGTRRPRRRSTCSSSSSTGRRRTSGRSRSSSSATTASAGVPMAPLVWGERETIEQMLWYTLILIAADAAAGGVRRVRRALPRAAALVLGGAARSASCA